MHTDASLFNDSIEELEVLDPVFEVSKQIDEQETPQIYLQNINNIHHYVIRKRILDVIGSSVGLVLLGLIYPFIALGIKLASKGPVLFVQERTGRNGKVFNCYKFRTMRTNIEARHEKGKPVVTQVGDPRIFTFGQFLRRTNLDELPQLINVLKGEMSLVGPRPLPVEECRYWRDTIPNFELRYMVRPGLTGWAQTTGYRGGNTNTRHMAFRLKRDFKYIENYSLTLDIKIIFRTIKQMVTRDTKAH